MEAVAIGAAMADTAMVDVAGRHLAEKTLRGVTLLAGFDALNVDLFPLVVRIVSNEAGHGMKTSTFSIGRDPGSMLKYGGSLLICLGIAIMFYMRAYFFKRAKPPQQATTQVSQVPSLSASDVVGQSEPDLKVALDARN